MPVRTGKEPPFRPANYPKVQKFTTEIENINTNNTVQNVKSTVLAPVEVSPYDDMFDNSMMISEEDLIIHGEDSFGAMAIVDEVNNGIYPLLPNKRK